MIHIGSENFYNSIKKDMQSLKDRDYVFFYEGVRVGTPESLEKLSNLMGMDVSPEMYDILANMAGLVVQETERFQGILPETNVDLSTDDIITLAQNL